MTREKTIDAALDALACLHGRCMTTAHSLGGEEIITEWKKTIETALKGEGYKCIGYTNYSQISYGKEGEEIIVFPDQTHEDIGVFIKTDEYANLKPTPPKDGR